MDVKDAMAGTVMAARDQLTGLSHRLHAHPEVAWTEERAAAWVAAELAGAGFDVEANACGLPTAFIARSGTGPLHIGICAEYDALPGLGHACGHNIIAAAAVGTGLALAAAADDLGLTVTVFGTPAEEGGGGKVYMLERGAFDGVHAAMMVHPGPVDVAEARPFAVSHMLVRYRGQATAGTPPTRSRTAPKAAGTSALRPSMSWPGWSPGCAAASRRGRWPPAVSWRSSRRRRRTPNSATTPTCCRCTGPTRNGSAASSWPRGRTGRTERPAGTPRRPAG